MRLFRALRDAIRIRRPRRIGRAYADRLVSGDPPDPDDRGLGVLLEAAAAPPSVEELAGERAAVARFVAAYRDAAPVPPARNRVRASRSVGMVAVRLAAGVAVLAGGGIAVAAETGNLPAGARQFLTGLGVPAPGGGPRPTATGPGRTGVSTHVPSPATPAPPSRGAPADPAEVVALDLCRTWYAARTNPRGKPVPAATRRALADLAGGVNRIAGFCDEVLGTSPGPSAATTGKAKDKKDKDQPKAKAEPHPTPPPKTTATPRSKHNP